MPFNFNGEDFLAIGAGLLSETDLARGAGKGLAMVGQNRKVRRKEKFEEKKFDALETHRARQHGLSVQQLRSLEKYRGAQLGLRSRALDSADAQRKVSNDLARQRLNLTREQMNNPVSIREFKAAKETGFEGSYVDFLTVKRSGSETFGKSPIYGQDANGNTVLIQPGSRGNANIMQLPEGITASSGVQKVDVGTGTAMVDKRTGQVIGVVPKNVAAAEAEKVKGKAQGTAVTELGQTITNAEGMNSVINQIAQHPGLDSAMGVIQGRLPSVIANPLDAQNVEDFRNIKSQLEGKAFLQAFDSLKGGGHITEIEGQKATEAIAVLRDTTSEKEFKNQLNLLKEIIDKGVANAKTKAGSITTPTAGGWTDLGNGVKIREKK